MFQNHCVGLAYKADGKFITTSRETEFDDNLYHADLDQREDSYTECGVWSYDGLPCWDPSTSIH